MSLPSNSVDAFWDEMEKISSYQPALYGALIGAALTGTRAIGRESPIRAQEDLVLSTQPEQNTAAMRRHLALKRAGRVSRSMVAGALAGGAVGHLGTKAFHAGLDSAVGRFKADIAPKLDNFAQGADRLSRAPERIEMMLKDPTVLKAVGAADKIGDLAAPVRAYRAAVEKLKGIKLNPFK